MTPNESEDNKFGENTEMLSNNVIPPSLPQRNPKIRVYRIRLLMIGLFVALSCSNAFQWIEYAIIESSITSYYGVSPIAVSWTSMLYMFTYILGIFPATWALDRFGLRNCLVVAAFGNALGSCVKCFSVSPTGFPITFAGQTIVATSQLFILNIPPLLAATWFPEKEVSLATSIGVFGNQVGIALGFFIPTMLVPEPDSTGNGETEVGLRRLFYGTAIVTSVLFVLILILFKAKPKLPPSRAQVVVQESSGNKESFAQSLKSLFFNINFVFIFISYGLNTGAFYAISTVLGQMVESAIGHGYTREAGLMGMIITLAGIFGALSGGYLLKVTSAYKSVTLFVYIFSLIGTVCFAIALEFGSIWTLYLISGLLGFFMTGYLPIGFEFGVEVSFPTSEGTSAGMLNVSAQMFGIIFTYISTWTIAQVGHQQTNIGFAAVLLIGAVLTALVRNVRNRQNVQISEQQEQNIAHIGQIELVSV